VEQELGSLGAHDGMQPIAPIGRSPDATGEDVLADAVRVVRECLGGRLLAAYALGSLAHGGFSALVSDVDLALVLADPIQAADAATLLAVAADVRAAGSPLHARLSVFWGTPGSLAGRAGGRFPPLDRLCLLEHGRLLIGADVRTGLPRPDRCELVVAGAEFALDALAEHVIDDAPRPESLLAGGIRWTTKIVLFPVRFLFTAETGHEGTNHAAVTHYLTQHDAPAAALVSAALDWRTDPPDPDDALALLRADLLPLYRHFLDDHIERLTAAGRPELAQAFLRWRTGLDDRAASAIHPRGHTRT
jgi:hypothetical protein